MQYSKFIEKARKLKGDQAATEVAFWELLVEQEKDELSWKAPKTPYKTWWALLRGEGLCTWSTYENYKKARALISTSWIKKFGVYASISISKLDADTRDSVFKTTKAWYTNYNVPPTYQRISKYVRDLGRASRMTKRENKIAKMRAYIKKCQALLKKNKIEIPEETWT